MIFTQWADLIFSDQGMICRLSDPTVQLVKHIDAPLDNTAAWDQAMANGEMIINALECLRLFGSLDRARQAAAALIVVENQYDSIEAAMKEHAGLFSPESEE